MSNNNDSRYYFNCFIEENKLARVDMRSVFDCKGVRYAFSFSTQGKAVCRQFYEDCDKLITLDDKTMKLYEFDRKDLSVALQPNRITTKGLKSYTAKADFNVGTLTHYKV